MFLTWKLVQEPLKTLNNLSINIKTKGDSQQNSQCQNEHIFTDQINEKIIIRETVQVKNKQKVFNLYTVNDDIFCEDL